MDNENLELFASCLSGLEAPLAEELKRLGIKRVRPLGGGVAFFCDVRHALSACLWSRLASRILVVVGRVNAGDANLLYEGVRRIAWEGVIVPGASMSVQAHGMNDELRNTRFTALKVKDAVCDRLREMRGERPDVDADHADVSVDVRVREGRATISLDLSGESLYHRSYLTPDDGPDAPLSCALAAGLLALAGWRTRGSRGEALVDPACGDGFLVVEAASAACDLAPGLTRERWGFFGWVPSDPDVWNELIDEADERGWLVKNENMTTPAMINSAKNLTIRANLEPIAGLKIDLNANRVDTRSTDIYYMQDGMPEQMGGSFTMTTIALGSAFGGSGNANNGYSSKAFDKFIAHRSVIAQRLMDTYSGTVYPSSGFMAGHALAGKPYDPAVGGGVSLNSMEYWYLLSWRLIRVRTRIR